MGRVGGGRLWRSGGRGGGLGGWRLWGRFRDYQCGSRSGRFIGEGKGRGRIGEGGSYGQRRRRRR